MLEGMIPYFKRALIVALLFGAFFAFTTSVFAQAFPPGSSADPFTPPFVNTGNNPGNPNAPGYFPGIGGGTGSVVSPGAGAGPGRAPAGPGGTVSETTNTPPGAEQVVEVSDGESCWSSPQGFFHCIATAFFGTFVAIAGYALDWSIELFITQFGQMYIDYGVGAVVEGTWGTVRDIFNLTFIFGLVYIGFQIILGINESGAKRTIPMLIVAALLVNFSLFIVKFIVDFSNLAALQIYNLFEVADTLNASGGQAKAGTIVDLLGGETSSISLAFINTIGVTSLLSHNPSAGAADGIPLFYTFGMIVVFLVLIYVFFAAAILITIRFAALTFYMIFSPIMFLGWVFPGMKQYSDKFWQGLFGQAFFAPALLFMLYISYQLSAGLAGPNRVDGSVFKNEANALGFAQFVPYLVLIVVFLMASLIVAKKMANQGASMVGKVNDWAVSKAGLAAGGMTAGLMARAGRNTVGAGANAMQNSKWGNELAARGGRLGKMVYGGVGKVADSSFDARKVGGVGKKMGVGEGRKGGMTTILKEEKESDEKFMKALGHRSADDYDPETKFYKKLVGDYETELIATKDVAKRTEIKTALAGARKSYADAAKKWEDANPEIKYGRQLNYINAMESWQSKQKFLGVGAAAAAGIIATGGLGLAAGAVAGASAGATSAGYWYNTKKAAGNVRKEYGADGSKKHKSESEEKKLKAVLAAAGQEKAKDDPGKEKGHGKDGGNDAPKAVAHAAPAPKAASSGGGGGGHDNHAHAGGH